MKIVTAIITTNNRKDSLKRAIDSEFAQTYPEIELIVVDDASDDGTSEISKNERINYEKELYNHNPSL
jgi:glycosyltransferase involved in cell wall biosynthesis